MYFSHDPLLFSSVFLKLVVTATALAAFANPPSTLGNPITKKQFQKVVKLLEESVTKELSSDDATQYSDILYQEKYEKKNLTYYHTGDKKFPVFISNGLASLNSAVHVLLRGEDYINPKDKNNFVVLKQLESKPGEYTVHQAHILDANKLKKGSKVIWNDGRVEQQKNIKTLLQQMGNLEVQARSLRSQRPLCDWIGYSLFCHTAKNLPPARERKEREPLDEEDDQPVKLPGIVSEENSEGATIKENSVPDKPAQNKPAQDKPAQDILAQDKPAQDDSAQDKTAGKDMPNSGVESRMDAPKGGRSANAMKLVDLVEDPSEEKSITAKGPQGREIKTEKTTTAATTTTTTPNAATVMGRRVIIKDVVPPEKVEEEEGVSKKKHKKKRKSKRKPVDANKE